MLGTKMKTEEAHSSICVDTERKQGDKHCKGKRVRETKKKWRKCRMCRCNTNAFTHRRSYAETLYTQTFWHRRFSTHTHALALTHRRFYIQTLLHTDAFTHRGVYTEAVSRTEMHRNLYTRTLLRTYALTQQNLAQSTSRHYFVLLCTEGRGGQRGATRGGKRGGREA